MKINQIITETSAGATGSGSVATVSSPLGATKTRNASIYGDQKVGSLFKGKKTNKPFANSITEGAVKQLSMDLKGGPDGLSDEEFKKKYGKTKAEVRKEMKNKPEPQKPVNEADLQEDDIIMVPGKGLRLKPGFHKIDPDKAEHEGKTLKNSLHTIIRVATHLDKELSVRDNFPEWVSEKIGATKSMMVSVMDYLISAKEMQHDPDAMDEMMGGVIAGGMANESEKVNEKAVSKAQQKFMGMVHAAQKGEKPASKEVAKVAKSMPKKAAKDFAKTKHKGLPEKVKKD